MDEVGNVLEEEGERTDQPELIRSHSEPLPNEIDPAGMRLFSIRHIVALSERRFDTATLPADLQRVYTQLAAKFGETYALTFCFTVRTACELHRAWHMTLLTNKILQQIKETFGMRMTCNLGVVKLIFRVEDGGFELHRRVPYDYDSEFQDIYMKIAIALVEGHIDIHQALIYQTETAAGKHTATSGLFLRTNPGRLVLYPAVAATCAVIFFGGDGHDAIVALACGLAAGLMDYLLNYLGGDFGLLVDVMVGIITGIVTGLFVRYNTSQSYCISAIFLGTLYWFFYGTAFVLGILEVLAGELGTGVTRFVAVSVKTFVLTLGSCIGLWFILLEDAFEYWDTQDPHCKDSTELDQYWWRIPLYLLCSASVLGQYRFPIAHYWRGLAVQLVGYEVQYRFFLEFQGKHAGGLFVWWCTLRNRFDMNLLNPPLSLSLSSLDDFLDTAISNIAGAFVSVLAACMVAYIVDGLGWYYNARLLQRHKERYGMFGEFVYTVASSCVRINNWLGIGRKSSFYFLRMESRLKQQTRELHDPNHPRAEIKLSPEEEIMLIEAVVDAEDVNIWSLLMPAIYQLVPGSLIARLWYNAVFPPPSILTNRNINIGGTNIAYQDEAADPDADDVFYGLMVISTSLALGLMLGFAAVSIFLFVWDILSAPMKANVPNEEQERQNARIKRMRFRQQGIMSIARQDDPDGGGGRGGARPQSLTDDDEILPQVAQTTVGTTTNIGAKVIIEEKEEDHNLGTL